MIKIIFAVVVGLTIGYGVQHFPIGRNLPVLIDKVTNQGLGGYLLYVTVSALGTAMFFPGSIFVMGAGYIWGIAKGSVIAAVFLTLSAALTFLISRYIARDWVVRKVSQISRLKLLDSEVKKSGFKFVFLIRLSPAFPFTILNYAYGTTGINFGSYILATLLGMIPGTIMYVYFGSIITEVAHIASSKLPLVEGFSYFKFIGFIITLVATTLIAKLAHKALSAKI